MELGCGVAGRRAMQKEGWMRSFREKLGRWIIESLVPSVFPRINPLTGGY